MTAGDESQTNNLSIPSLMLYQLNHFAAPSVCLSHEIYNVLLDFSLTVKVAPHVCVIRSGQP